MAPCPHLEVGMGGVTFPCLLDTGSMVSTVIESFFLQHFKPWGQERLQACRWLKLTAANGLAIPYTGYLELDIDPKCGVLVVRYSPGMSAHFRDECHSQVLQRAFWAARPGPV